LSGTIGWHSTVLVWVGIASLGTLICALAAHPWKRFIEKG
jgi:hypothetical protein